MTKRTKKRDHVLQLLVLLVLVASIAVGIILVKQSQDFRLGAQQQATY